MGADSLGGAVAADAPPTRSRGPGMLERRGLEHRLDDVLDRRLALIVAGAGYGKTTLLRTWAQRHHAGWRTLTAEDRDAGVLARRVAEALLVVEPELDVGGLLGAAVAGEVRDDGRPARLATFLCGAIAERATGDLVLVLDDGHELPSGSESARLLADMCRQAPPRLHLVVASRRDVPFPVARLRAQGQVVDLGGPALAFSPDEVRTLCERTLGDNPDLAATVHAATGGWPAAVRLAVEALRSAPLDDRERVIAGLSRPEGPMFTWLTEEVITREPREVRELLPLVAPLERFNGELVEAIGVHGARELTASLARQGLLVVPHADEPGWCSLHPLVRAVVDARVPSAERPIVLRRAAAWLEANGEARDALGCRRRAADWPGVERLLRDHGSALVLAGAAPEVIAAAAALPPDHRVDDVVLLEAEAHHARGDSIEALACMERLLPAEGPIAAAYAWRAGLIHLHRGDLERALGVFQRASRDGTSADRAQLLAWECNIRSTRGEYARCSALADGALEAARESGDDRALAAAFLAKALAEAFDEDPRTHSMHLSLAFEHATQAADAVVIACACVYRGAAHHLRGEYREALVALDDGLRMADVTGIGAYAALMVALRGQTLLRLGRVEEAKRDAEAARSLVREQGASSAGFPFVLEGEIHRECGERALALAAFEEALLVGEATSDVSGIVAALSGLAGLRAATDPVAGEAAVKRALSYGLTNARPHALLTGAWVALISGNDALARERTEEAAAVARRRHDRAGLGAVIELRAALEPELARRQALLEQATSLWGEIGDPLSAARVDLSLARLFRDAGDDETARAHAGRAAGCYAVLGLRRRAAQAAEVARTRHRKPVEVTTLGRFAVDVEGRPVEARAWQSRKARDLLKILVSRRGRPVHREILIDLLWPDDGAERGSSRLSVALSTLRGVLDPGKQHQPDDFVASDGAAVWLCRDRVAVDLESFLAAAEAERLAEADAAYTGDFLEEDAYAEWAVPLREETRLAYVSVARSLADEAARSGDHDAAMRHLLRILERDPYDESAHLAIAAAFAGAGRHGEARRAYQSYCTRMDELGVEPAMFPSPARPSPTKVD